MKRLPLVFAILCCMSCGQSPKNPALAYRWEDDLEMRLAQDFSDTREEVKEYIQKYIPDVTDAQIDSWTASGKLESMLINGETMYFYNAGPNLFRIDPECHAVKAATEQPAVLPDFSSDANIRNIVDVINSVKESDEHIVEPRRMKIKFTLTVGADEVPAGEVIRCWLPFPRKDVARQTDVELIRTNVEDFIYSDPECAHSSIYMEKTAVAGEPTVFEEEFAFTSCGEWYKICADSVKACALTDADFRKYTSEQAPHIVFTDQMRMLSDELTEGLENPYDKALSIFTWINDNFPWASAREYSTIPCIPQYVLDNGHGDCGQVTLLFMTLARIAGIPVRWQSGLTVTPGDDNMHDWAEVYFEGYGWVPLDMSRGLNDEYAIRTTTLACQEGVVPPSVYQPDFAFADEYCKQLNDDVMFFNIGGIDSYRLIINNGFGDILSPAKQYPRSETVDFQRGEAEWSGGNLYFGQWRRKVTITYE